MDQTDGLVIRSQIVGRKREATGHTKKEKKAKDLEAKAAAIEYKNEKVEVSKKSL